MARQSEHLRSLAVFFGGVVVFTTLLWSCKFWVSGTIHGQSLLLLCHSLGFIALAFLWIEFLFGGAKANRNAVFAMLLTILATTVVGYLVWGRHLGSAGVVQIAIWQGLQALPLLSLTIGRRLVLRSNTMGLEIIAGGMVLLMAPILLEGFLAGARNPETARLMVDSGLAVSSWSTASQEFLALDLFKAEQMYREYRIGEKIYQVPMVKETLPVVLVLSGLILGMSCVLRGGRLVCGRLWAAVT